MQMRPITRRQLLAGTAALAAMRFVENEAIAQNSVHPKNDDGLPPVPADEPIPGTPFLKCGPMLGHIDHERALLWLKASNTSRATIRYGTTSDLGDARMTSLELSKETAFSGVAGLKELKPSTRYYYSVQLGDTPATLLPHASFITAPVPGSAGKARIAFVSCAGYRGYMAAASWGEMAEHANFDLILQLGDNHYANSPDLEKQRAYYTMHRKVTGFRALTNRVPCYGIWDDHDYGPNDSDGTLVGKENALRAFKEFWANPAYGLDDTPGCFFKITRGDVEIYMLDVRYHRSPDNAEQTDAKTMLGAAQLEWLKKELTASKARIKFIASGSTFDNNGLFDSWKSYTHERRVLLDFLREIDGVILLSGDRHFTAGYQVEGRFIEVTSGPVGSGNSTVGASNEMWLSCGIGKMWSIFEVDTSPSKPVVAYELWMAGAGMVERREFTWDEINGRSKIAPSDPLPRIPGAKKTAQ
jgi:alkaline phosphatase D